MQIEYHSGDVIAAAEPVIIHGCNAQGVMGRGVADAVKQRLPFAFRAYREQYLSAGLRLGQVVWAINLKYGERPRIVGNAITQEHWEQRYALNGRLVSYGAIRLAMCELDRLASLTQIGDPPDWNIEPIGPITRVAMPRIGAGYGGGDWAEIAGIIEQESVHFRPIVYVK